MHSYWTQGILVRCPAVAHLAPVAAAHHERLDGSGYHRNARGAELDPARRVIAAMTESRPYRPALGIADAARELLTDVSSGKIDAVAAAAVIEAAGLPRPPVSWPCDLTGREVDVLRLWAPHGSGERKASADAQRQNAGCDCRRPPDHGDWRPVPVSGWPG